MSDRLRATHTWPIALLVVLGVVLVASCDRYTVRTHELSAPTIEVATGIHVSVSTSGYWKTNSDGSAENDGTYVISVRVWGTGTDVGVASFRITDPATGSVAQVHEWAPAVRDPSDAGLLLLHRPGVALSFSDQEVSGVLRVGSGEGASSYPFEVTLTYRFREEKKSRFFAALNSV